MLPVKLDDLIEVAVRMSPDLSRAKLERVAAKEDAEGSRRNQAWILGADASWTRQGNADHVDLPPYSVVASEKTEADINIGRNLPTGAQVQVRFDVSHTSTEYNITDQLTDPSTAMNTQSSPSGMNPQGQPYEFSDQTQATLSLQFKQPLARGFGSDVALAQEHKADLAATEATLQAQLKAEQMVNDVVKAYWDLAYAAFEADVRVQSLELAKKQGELTHEQMRAGTAPPSAINQVDFEIANREGQLLQAQLTVEQKSLELREKVGLDLGQRSVVMQPAEAFEIGKDEFDVDEVLARTRIANHQLADILLQKKIADIGIAVASDQAKPQLDLQVQGALVGVSDSVGAAIGGVTGGDNFQVMVGLNGSFELSGAARKSRDAAITRKRKLDFDRAALERHIETQVVTAVHLVTAARQRVALADRAVAVGEENVRAERNNFMVSRTTNLQVMQVQTKLIQARLDRGKAVTDFHKAVADLQYLSGTLLEQYRVNVRPQR